MDFIAKDLWVQIIELLNDVDLFAMAQVCKLFNNIIANKRQKDLSKLKSDGALMDTCLHNGEFYNLKCTIHTYLTRDLSWFYLPIDSIIQSGLITIIKIILQNAGAEYSKMVRCNILSYILAKATKYNKPILFETLYIDYLSYEYPINRLNYALISMTLANWPDAIGNLIKYMEKTFSSPFYFDSYFRKNIQHGFGRGYKGKILILRQFDSQKFDIQYVILSRFKRLDWLFLYIINSNDGYRLLNFIKAMRKFNLTIGSFSKIKHKIRPDARYRHFIRDYLNQEQISI